MPQDAKKPEQTKMKDESLKQKLVFAPNAKVRGKTTIAVLIDAPVTTPTETPKPKKVDPKVRYLSSINQRHPKLPESIIQSITTAGSKGQAKKVLRQYLASQPA